MSCRSPVTNAKPNAKLPVRTVKVLCAACREPLYKVLLSISVLGALPAGSLATTQHALLLQYHKNGNGKLVKCWHERIAEDYTNKDLKCPQCGLEFARATMVRGLPANKIIGGKVILKR